MHADLYDYDGTICPGDTGSAFWLYCLLRRPYILVFLPLQLAGVLYYLCGRGEKPARYLTVYCYLRAVNGPKLAQRFAEKRVRKTYPYFINRDRTHPAVVCSASPEFLIRPACERLGVGTIMGSPVDPRTGRFFGANCHGAEKVRRFRAAYPDADIENFYSDSHSDDPLARLAQKAWLVKGDRLLPW
jgi:hypothetical protein